MSTDTKTTSRCVDMDTAELSRIEQLGPNLFAIVFSLMKLVVARHLLRIGEAQGLLRPGVCVIESTSGTMGLALAYACRERGYSLTLVGDPAIDRGLQLRLHALGTTLVIVRNRLKTGGYQQARINKLFELQRECRATFWTNQYNNPEAPNAYSRVAEWLHRSKRSVDVLVAPVGTGSCATGLTRELRALGHSAVLIAVDTHGSVLFGLQDGKRLLRGLGNSIIPTNLDYRVVDECHWVSAAEAFYLTNYIYRELLLDVGPSSAAAYMAAEWAARTNPAKSVFFVCADGGERYRFTVGDPAWRRFNGVEISQVPSEPINVTDPTQVGRSWSAMKWCRRRLVDASVIPAY